MSTWQPRPSANFLSRFVYQVKEKNKKPSNFKNHELKERINASKENTKLTQLLIFSASADNFPC